MEQPAIWFFIFLEEAYKLQANEYENLGYISMLPHIKDDSRKRWFDSISRSQRDIIEIGKYNDDYSALEQLKKEFK